MLSTKPDRGSAEIKTVQGWRGEMFSNDERIRKHAQNLQRYSGTYIQKELSELMEDEDQKHCG
jgi:hypothetical protein